MSIGSVGNGKRKRYADTHETAHYMGVSEAFLEKNRCTGKVRIPYVKLSRKILYDLDVIDGVMAELTCTSTSTSDGGRAA